MTKKPLIKTALLTIGIVASNSIFAWTRTSDVEEAMKLTPNLENGREVYETCAICHSPQGWGTPDGRFPEIAGQHANVIIKQLSDIRVGNRDNPTMYPFSLPESIGGAQNIADVAAYISQLPLSRLNEVGSGYDVTHGEKLYKQDCVECHGENGEGHNDDLYPRLHGQHYHYLVRQLFNIQFGRRRNADEKMVKIIHDYSARDLYALADYISRLEPPEELVAKPDWRNPDFPDYFRSVPHLPYRPPTHNGPMWDEMR